MWDSLLDSLLNFLFPSGGRPASDSVEEKAAEIGYRRKLGGAVEVPDVHDLPFDIASHRLTARRLKAQPHNVEPHPAPVMAIVMSQRVAAGTTVEPGTVVEVDVLHPPAGADLQAWERKLESLRRSSEPLG